MFHSIVDVGSRADSVVSRQLQGDAHARNIDKFLDSQLGDTIVHVIRPKLEQYTTSLAHRSKHLPPRIQPLRSRYFSGTGTASQVKALGYHNSTSQANRFDDAHARSSAPCHTSSLHFVQDQRQRSPNRLESEHHKHDCISWSSLELPKPPTMGKFTASGGFKPSNNLSADFRNGTKSLVISSEASGDQEEGVSEYLTNGNKRRRTMGRDSSRSNKYASITAHSDALQRSGKSQESAMNAISIASMSQSNSILHGPRHTHSGESSEYKDISSLYAHGRNPRSKKATAAWPNKTDDPAKPIPLDNEDEDPIQDDGPTKVDRSSIHTQRVQRLTAEHSTDDDLEVDELSHTPPKPKHVALRDRMQASDDPKGEASARSVMAPFRKSSEAASICSEGNIPITTFRRAAKAISRAPPRTSKQDSIEPLPCRVRNVGSGVHQARVKMSEVSHLYYALHGDTFYLMNDKDISDQGDPVLKILCGNVSRIKSARDGARIVISRSQVLKEARPAGTNMVFVEFDGEKDKWTFHRQLLELAGNIEDDSISSEAMDRLFTKYKTDYSDKAPSHESPDISLIKSKAAGRKSVASVSMSTDSTEAMERRIRKGMLSKADLPVVKDYGLLNETYLRRSTRARNSQEFPAEGASTRRSDVRPSYRSTTPVDEPPIWSESHPHFQDWKTALIWPAEPAKKRVTIVESDISKLEKSAYLNDAIIEFYLRFLEFKAERAGHSERIHILSTFFYSKLADRGYDYAAVSRWTAKVDIFAMNYVLVPINQNSHWYIIVICNPGSCLREARSESSEAQAKDATSVLSPAAQLAASTEEVSETAYTNAVTKPLHQLSLDDSSSRDNSHTDEMANDVVEIAAPPAKPRKFRAQRKSNGAPRYKPGKAMIVSMDSMGGKHQLASSTIRHWLEEEAFRKHGVKINKKVEHFNALSLPEQPDTHNCGIYLLAYMEQFFDHPDGFIRQALQPRSGNRKIIDDINSQDARTKIRQLLLDLRKQQLHHEDKVKHKKSLAKAKDLPRATLEPLQDVCIEDYRITERQAHKWNVDNQHSPMTVSSKSSILEKLRNNIGKRLQEAADSADDVVHSDPPQHRNKIDQRRSSPQGVEPYGDNTLHASDACTPNGSLPHEASSTSLLIHGYRASPQAQRTRNRPRYETTQEVADSQKSDFGRGADKVAAKLVRGQSPQKRFNLSSESSPESGSACNKQADTDTFFDEVL